MPNSTAFSVTFLLLLSLGRFSLALQCRDGFFLSSRTFDVDRSSPEPQTCPETAEAGCVRFEVDGTFTTGGQQIEFDFWMTSCGSSENCTASCTDELENQMLRILRSVGRDDSITADSSCSTACCSGDDCNTQSVDAIIASGNLAVTAGPNAGNRVAASDDDAEDGNSSSNLSSHLASILLFVSASCLSLM